MANILSDVGFGSPTTGGLGGVVKRVTNLNASGPGSFAYHLNDGDGDGPRIIEFDVGGLIQLTDRIDLVAGDVTVRGDTAPEAVVLRGGRIRVLADNVIIHGLEIRPGDLPQGENGSNRDGISVGDGTSVVDRVIIDGNTITWATDEGLTSWGKNTNITFSHNIIAETLENSINGKGPHSMGLLVGSAGDGGNEITIFGNLLVSNRYRNALVKDGYTRAEFVNNLVVNGGIWRTDFGSRVVGHVINNVYIDGPDTSLGNADVRLSSGNAGTQVYVSGNIKGDGTPVAIGGNSNVVNNGVPVLATGPLFTSSIVPMAANLVEAYVLANAGARCDNRSDLDRHLLDRIASNDLAIIDSQFEIGNAADGIAWDYVYPGPNVIPPTVPVAGTVVCVDAGGFTNIETDIGFSLAWPDGHQAGDIMMVSLGQKRSVTPSSGSYAASMVNLDAVLVDDVDPAGRAVDVNMALGYIVAQSDNEPDVVFPANGNLGSPDSAMTWKVVRGSDVPELLNLEPNAEGATVTIGGGAVDVGDGVGFFVQGSFDSDLPVLSGGTAVNVQGLELEGAANTSQGTGHGSYAFLGTAAAESVGPLTAQSASVEPRMGAAIRFPALPPEPEIDGGALSLTVTTRCVIRY